MTAQSTPNQGIAKINPRPQVISEATLKPITISHSKKRLSLLPDVSGYDISSALIALALRSTTKSIVCERTKVASTPGTMQKIRPSETITLQAK